MKAIGYSVCVESGMNATEVNQNKTAVIYALDADNNLTSIHYPAPPVLTFVLSYNQGETIPIDGESILNGTSFYVGKTAAENILIYEINKTN